jgi:hypothetical protein
LHVNFAFELSRHSKATRSKVVGKLTASHPL